jgi:hypothetical protein
MFCDSAEGLPYVERLRRWGIATSGAYGAIPADQRLMDDFGGPGYHLNKKDGSCSRARRTWPSAASAH